MQTLTNCQNVAGLWLKYGVAPPGLAGERWRFAAQKKRHDATIY